MAKYEYSRNLPYVQKDDRAHFITFNSYKKWVLPPAARDVVLKACLVLNGKKVRLNAVVVMPEHVHMIFLVLRNAQGENHTFAEILGPLKGYTVHAINKQMRRRGHVWQDESFDHVLRSEEN